MNWSASATLSIRSAARIVVVMSGPLAPSAAMKQEGAMKLPKALAFDVFGTVVDWRSGIARDVAPLLDQLGRTDITPEAFADGWRVRYQPAMARVRSGERPFVI